MRKLKIKSKTVVTIQYSIERFQHRMFIYLALYPQFTVASFFEFYDTTLGNRLLN